MSPRRAVAPDPADDLAGYAAANPDVRAVLGTDAAKLVRHWQDWGFREGRTPYGFAPYRSRRLGPGFWDRAPAVTMYGFFDAASGIGQAGRAYLSGLRAAGIDVTPITVTDRDGLFDTRPDVRPHPHGLLRRTRLPEVARRTRVNLLALNADMIHRFLMDGRRPILDDAYTIAIWFWELAAFPQDWADTFGALDEIWVASEFCRQAIGAVAPIPVVTVPMPVVASPPGPADLLPRSHFGLPDDTFLFGCVFDVGSVVRRKNPLGALDAFLSRFRGRRDAMLVLKFHGTGHYPESVAPLLRAAEGHANVRLIDRSFDTREMASWPHVLDCLVSPHRSEGFGFNLAEALLAARPVIATGWSGNRAFMGPAESFPVRYRLAEVGAGAWPYPEAALWAEPDGGDLADGMEEVFANRAAAADRARRGRIRITTGHDIAAAGSAIRARLDPVLGRRPDQGPPSAWGAGRHHVARFHGAEVRLAVIAPLPELDPEGLASLVDATQAQIHANWELLLPWEPGLSDDLPASLAALRGRDPRLVVPPSAGGPDPILIEDVLAMTTGRTLVLLRSGRDLAPGTLQAIAAAGSGRAGRSGASSPSGQDSGALIVSREKTLAHRDVREPYRFATLLRIASVSAGALIPTRPDGPET